MQTILVIVHLFLAIGLVGLMIACLMAALSGILLAACIRSFVRARLAPANSD